MINRSEILQTIAMIDQQHLDIRTITMGISLLDCADADIERSCTKVYDKICRLAGDLVRTGEDIEAEVLKGLPTREQIQHNPEFYQQAGQRGVASLKALFKRGGGV